MNWIQHHAYRIKTIQKMTKDAGLDQKDVAKGIGMSQSNFSKYMTGLLDFHDRHLHLIAKFLKADPSVLIDMPKSAQRMKITGDTDTASNHKPQTSDLKP